MAEWIDVQLGSAGCGLVDHRATEPVRMLIAALASVMVYIGLRVAGWSAAAQWVLVAAIVVGTLAVALQLLAELDDGIGCPPDHAGFSNDPDELDAQLVTIRPAAAVTVDSELPVYSQTCRTLGLNPLAGAGVR